MILVIGIIKQRIGKCMKIGLSYSRCVRDIVEGKVTMDDVLVVITRTDFDPNDDEQWKGIWAGYCKGSYLNMNMEWIGYDHDNPEHEKLFRDASIDLWKSGKFFQPRQFGAHPRRLPYIWLETILVDEDLDQNPALKAAWNNFQITSALCSKNIDKKPVA